MQGLAKRSALASVWRWAQLLSMIIAACIAWGTAHAETSRVGNPQAAQDDLLTVYSTADYRVVLPVLEAFVQRHPGLGIDYHELQSQDLFKLAQQESSAADLVWSSAMDLQMKLVNDGYAKRVSVASKADLPDWAFWRDEAYAVSVEPAVLVYNRDDIADDQVPRNRAELVTWLDKDPAAFAKVGTYDIERSGLGLLLAASDAQRSSDFWRLVTGLGHNQVSLYSSSSALIERVIDGRLSLAYNVLGSYAAARAAQDPRLGVVLLDDYTLVISRIAFVPANANNPDKGELFLTYLLSEQGQRVLNDTVGFPAVHQNVPWTQKLFPSPDLKHDTLDPLEVDTGLLVFMDRVRRDTLIRLWRESLNGAL